MVINDPQYVYPHYGNRSHRRSVINPRCSIHLVEYQPFKPPTSENYLLNSHFRDEQLKISYSIFCIDDIDTTI